MNIIRGFIVYFIITIHYYCRGFYLSGDPCIFSDPSTLQSLNNLGIPLDHVEKIKMIFRLCNREEAYLIENRDPFDVFSMILRNILFPGLIQI
ncbi:MAG: hypothetical protein CM1200mP10_09230 [Candidatus Neomarinimicrobiota bacterium]|nr:MAG: hypothetical protein CM1200mP10_09230 [Candidatus Neomarinimicrobiota bacterium]